MILSKYVQEAVINFETHLKEQCGGKYSLVKDVANPFAYHYEPKVEVSDPLDPEMESYYHYLIDIIWWMVEFGLIDIATGVSILLSHKSYPREGNFLSAFHIMS